MNRRRILQGGAASVALPLLGIIKPKAATLPFLAQASHFDGNTYCVNTNGIPSFPASSGTGFLAFSVATGAPGTVAALGLTNSNFNHYAFIRIESGGIIHLQLIGDSAASSQMHALSPSTVALNGNYNTACLAWNGTSCSANINGNPVAMSVSTMGGGFDVNYSGRQSYIGGYPSDIKLIGNLAFLYFVAGQVINPTNAISEFYDVQRGFAIRNENNGANIIEGIPTPHIFLSGPPLLFPSNLASSTFTWPSASNDTGKFSVVGQLTEASSDPYEPGSPF